MTQLPFLVLWNLGIQGVPAGSAAEVGSSRHQLPPAPIQPCVSSDESAARTPFRGACVSPPGPAASGGNPAAALVSPPGGCVPFFPQSGEGLAEGPFAPRCCSSARGPSRKSPWPRRPAPPENAAFPFFQPRTNRKPPWLNKQSRLSGERPNGCLLLAGVGCDTKR